ncbi:hypothetical protein [Pseudoxanthomonas sp. 10H]|uniref:hypothetical protein n=1 Tax=Pseudoxanthomonas sp. 10H TaxID=3242729 RepID=UPI003556D1B1
MQGMKVVYSGPVDVSYGQLYAVSPGCTPAPLERTLAGQENGLCGARVPGCLMLMCGLHSGQVQLEVLSFPAEPPLEASWPDVVEVPFAFLSSPVVLQDWEGRPICNLPVDGPGYMVRWCARNFGQAEDAGRVDDGEPFEEYALQLWPSTSPVERVVRQADDKAGYWHRYARSLPAPA